MARLIDANFAQHIANVELSPDDAGTVQWVLSHTPTVDAVPVVHGRKFLGRHPTNVVLTNQCSKCAAYMLPQDNYCPNCGAIMDLEVKDA